MLRWCPRFQVATTCFSCSPPDLNLVVTNFMFCLHVKLPLPPGNNPIAVNKYYYYYYYCYYYYSDWLGAARPGIESWWGRDFPPVQIGPGTNPPSCKMGTGSFPGVKGGRGVLLTTQPLLVPRSWKDSVRVAGWSTLCFSLQHGHHSNPAAPNLQHTMNREHNNRCGNSTAKSQAPDDGYINVRNMLSTSEVK